MATALSEAETSQLAFYYVSYLMALGHASGLRQKAINAAALLFRRFYAARPLASVDPLLVVPTVLVMASKIAECQVAAPVIVRVIPQLEQELGCRNPYGVVDILKQVGIFASPAPKSHHRASGRVLRRRVTSRRLSVAFSFSCRNMLSYRCLPPTVSVSCRSGPSWRTSAAGPRSATRTPPSPTT